MSAGKDLQTDQRWAALMARTSARLALGRSGASLPTQEVLKFDIAHAQARDAVLLPFRSDEVEASVQALGLETLQVSSAAEHRDVYLRRPDLGRALSERSRALLAAHHRPYDLAIVIADGLSSTAVHLNATGFLEALLPHLHRAKTRLAPVVIASNARVALGDDVASALGARMVAVLIGERPGLSSPDSLGLYLTLAPRVGLTDAARNCISNVRPEGLPYDQAAFKLAWLMQEALRRGVSGVELKDESDNAAGLLE